MDCGRSIWLGSEPVRTLARWAGDWLQENGLWVKLQVEHQRPLLDNLMDGFQAEGEITDIGFSTERMRRKSMLRTQILEDMIVQQHSCQNLTSCI